MTGREGSERSQGEQSRVFLMIRFRNTREHTAITRTLEEVLVDYGLELVRADWHQQADELWSNVCRHMDASGYGIAVLEAIHEPQSPNVSLELGYMLAKGKRCLLLKERQLELLPVDLVGRLYEEFDVEDLQATLTRAARKWLRDLGYAKRRNERWLVYVSSGGTCRDAMAKAITDKLLAERRCEFDIQVRAVALSQTTDREASRGARNAIRNMFGEDILAGHRPTAMTAALATHADLILVMDHVLQASTYLLPAEKTFVFKPFFGLEGDIADPWRAVDDATAEAERYGRCAAELEQILRRRFDRVLEFLRQGGESPPDPPFR